MSPSEDLLRLWARVEGHLRGVLSTIEVEASTRSMTEEFLDHNELGLAFETLVHALVDGGTTLPPEARSHLAAAAKDMGLQDNADWQILEVPDT